LMTNREFSVDHRIMASGSRGRRQCSSGFPDPGSNSMKAKREMMPGRTRRRGRVFYSQGHEGDCEVRAREREIRRGRRTSVPAEGQSALGILQARPAGVQIGRRVGGDGPGGVRDQAEHGKVRGEEPCERLVPALSFQEGGDKENPCGPPGEAEVHGYDDSTRMGSVGAGTPFGHGEARPSAKIATPWSFPASGNVATDL